MSDLEVRHVPESDLDRVMDLADMAFHARTEDDKRERLKWMPRRADRVGVYDGDELAGFLAGLPERMSVPGGDLGCAAVTFVGVLPTHRRRGVLTMMIDRMFARAAEHGQPLAALFASEAVIYGRFGFGQATRAVTLKIDATRPLKLRIEPDARSPRLVPRERAAEVLAELYARACARRPGQLRRDPDWWANVVVPEVHEEDDDLTTPRIVVIDGDPGGFAIYRVRGSDGSSGAPTIVEVEELEADTPAVEARLWQYLVSIDLVDQVKAWSVPVDGPLPLIAADTDQVKIMQDWGALWLRLVDVPAALEGRSWAAGTDLVLDVRDERIPANHGRWRLRTRADGGPSCARTDAEPDLSLDVRELGAAYLGGTRVRQLARVGLVTEHTPGAADRLDGALAVPLAPFTADQF
ncbi:GNAT family N-acetyltransferase [Spirillospora sp. CA-294931]|uniref:GNAT family N-acetyltransferase n=1 Tax=Spirillospora sp. CA-294931 TaxID=3240042 RepID=UPI003D8B35F8